MSVAATIAPSSPYKGLAAFDDTELDALLFFGRSWETEVVAANVLASRLTVLYGPSGVGKSSLLRAGVVRTLRSDGGYPSPAVAVYGSWSGNPLTGMEEAARVAVAEALGREPVEPPGDLTDRLAAWSAELGAEVCLLLDQLEELFLYHPASDGAGGFIDLLPELVARPGLHVNVLLGIRDDALAQLDVLKERIPGLFANSLRLDHLDRDAGHAAIVGPLERYNSLVGPAEAVTIEPELEEAVLDEVAAGRIEPGGARRGAANGGASSRIETPYLQLVLQRVWDVERDRGSSALRLTTFGELGGAQRIVEDHLERALDALTPSQQDAAATVFGHLVTPSGTKIAHGLSDLASYASVPETELEPMLQSLARKRILRPLGRNGSADGGQYEIFHDVLAEAVLGWRRRHDAEAAFALERDDARRRHKRLVALLITATTALVLVTLLAAYAITQRGRARDQARSAKVASLVSGATANLGRDPELGMLLAVEAAGIGKTEELEDVLRRSLENSRLRGVSKAAAEIFPSRDLKRASAGGTRVAARGDDVLVHVDGRSAVTVHHGSLVRVVDIARDGTIAWGGGGTAAVWNPRQTARPIQLLGHAGTVLDVRFSPDGETLATASADGTARVWSAESGALIATLFGHGNWVTRLAFSPDVSVLATASDDRTARLWEAGTGRPLATLTGHRGAVTDLKFERGGAILVTAGTDRRVLRWDGFGEPRLRPGRTSPVDPVTRAVSTSGRRAVVDGRVARLSGGGEEQRVLVGHFDDINSVAFSSDGNLVVTAGRDKDARVWDAATGKLVQILRGHFGPVAAASFSPDARWVVTAGPHSAGLWEVASGRLVYYLRGHEAALVAASFLSDSRIATADQNGEVRAYTCQTCGRLDDLVQLARRRLAVTGRELTSAQRARYLP